VKIENKTRWRTEDIRHIVGQCLRESVVDVKSTGLHVEIGVARKEIGTWKAVRGGGIGQGPPFVRVNITNAPKSGFDPSSPEHTDRVITFTRAITNALIALHGGHVLQDDRPIRWLADWYEVRLSAKGKLADCPVSPLMPTVAKPKPDTNAEKYAHARVMLAEATTRLKRATSIAKRWQRRVNYYAKKGAS
jgi:hypothetical protein